jgi:hypothetical protein
VTERGLAILPAAPGVTAAAQSMVAERDVLSPGSHEGVAIRGRLAASAESTFGRGLFSPAARQSGLHSGLTLKEQATARANSAGDLPNAIFAKTNLGQQEIQQRSLGLPLLVRRLLVLVDGKRSVGELAGFVPGHDVGMLLDELSGKGCIEPVSASPAAPQPASTATAAPDAPLATVAAAAAAAAANAVLATLPPPGQRNAKQLDMARNFMINTINTMLEQNSRLSLVEKIFKSADAAELRTHYAAWEEAIATSWIGAKRLPELRKKLFAVL